MCFLCLTAEDESLQHTQLIGVTEMNLGEILVRMPVHSLMPQHTHVSYCSTELADDSSSPCWTPCTPARTEVCMQVPSVTKVTHPQAFWP